MQKIKKGNLIVVGSIVLLFILFNLIPFLFPIFLIAAIILLKVKYPIIKGAVGELRIKRILNNLDSSYTVYHDLYVPNDVGGTTQVDHVVTSRFGIFVIETKHYRGWLFGDEKQRYWIQVIYKRKEKMFNPIWQNYGHIQAIKNHLPIENMEFIYSIIAFSEQSTFKFKNDFKSATVIHFPQLLEVIQERKVHSINNIELQKINRALDDLVIKDEKEKKQVKMRHVDSIKNNLREKETPSKENITHNNCPRCGGNMTKKNGKYGVFYGCTNYPKCRVTKRVS